MEDKRYLYITLAIFISTIAIMYFLDGSFYYFTNVRTLMKLIIFICLMVNLVAIFKRPKK